MNIKSDVLKKLILIPLTAMMLLTSCGTGNTQAPASETTASNAETTSASEETTAAETKVELPAANFEGSEATVLINTLGSWIYVNENLFISGDDTTADIINDSLWRIQGAVEDKGQLTLKQVTAAKSEFTDLYNQAVLSGDDAYDIVLSSSEYSNKMQYCIDLNEVEYINLEQPYWDQSLNDVQNVAGKQYYAINDMDISRYDACIVMFFNKKIADDYKVGNLYDVVRDGEWTFDKMYSVSKSVSSDLNGDGAFDDRDMYPYVSQEQNSYIGFIIGSGERLVTKNNDGSLILGMTGERFADVFSKTVDILGTVNFVYNPRVMPNTGTDAGKSVFRLFNSSQSLFMSHGLGSVTQYRDMKDDFGIIPMPKYSADQEQHYTVVNSHKYFSVPKSCSSTELSGYVLEALAYYGNEYLYPAYYEKLLTVKLIRDEETVEMLDKYILNNLIDSRIAGVDFVSPVRNLVMGSQVNLASFLASNTETFNAQIEAAMEEFNK